MTSNASDSVTTSSALRDVNTVRSSSNSTSRFRLQRRRTSSSVDEILKLPPTTSHIVSEGFIEVVFLLLGVGILLPWNAFISAKDYFESRLCAVGDDDGHGGNGNLDDGNDDSIANNIEVWFSIVYNGGTVLSLAVVILVQYLMDNPEHRQQQQQQQQQQRELKFSRIGSMLFESTTNLTNPMSPMSTKTVRIDTARGDADYTWYMVMVPLAAYLGVFAITTLSVFVTSIPPSLFLFFTLSGLFVCGVCTAVASSGIVGTAGLFEPDIGVNPFFNGQAVGGLLVACGNFLASILNGSAQYLIEHCTNMVFGGGPVDDASLSTAAAASDAAKSSCLAYSKVSWATAGYFSIGCLVLAASMVGYSYVDQYKRSVRANSLRGETTGYSSIGAEDYDDDARGDDAHDDDDDDDTGETYLRRKHQIQQHMSIEDTPAPASETGVLPARGHAESARSKWRKRASVSFASYQTGGIIEHVHEYDQHSGGCDSTDSESAQSLTMSVWTSVKGTAASLFFTYFCTLAIFPVWTSELISVLQCESSSRIRNDLFTPFSFILFNAGDLVGRSMSGMVKFDTIRNLSSKLVGASVLRMVFFFLFLLCKARYHRYTTRFGEQSSWVVQTTDWLSWTVQFSFAVTNGFMTNIAFCYAPGLVQNNAHPQQVASAILNFALSFGLLVGSFCSGPYFNFASGAWK